MNIIESIPGRNETFAKTRFDAKLRMMPTGRTLIVGCVDPRVDPAEVLGLELGETAIIRNVGGRMTPETLRTLDMLNTVGKAQGGLGEGWNLVVLHHTDCGIKRIDDAALAAYFDVPENELGACAIHDPHASVVHDIAAVRAHPSLQGTLRVTGLVYDVATGRVETVVETAPLRS